MVSCANSIIMKNKFRERLKELRQEKGLSQDALSKKVGFTTACISLWERGVRMPSIENVIVLVEFFGTTAGCLIGTEE